MATARAIGRGKIYIPVDILDRLKIKVGDELEVDVREDKEIVLQPMKESAVDRAFGIWADRDEIGDSVEYVRKMREGWRKRTEGIDGQCSVFSALGIRPCRPGQKCP